MVIFHSYVKLPEGKGNDMGKMAGKWQERGGQLGKFDEPIDEW